MSIITQSQKELKLMRHSSVFGAIIYQSFSNLMTIILVVNLNPSSIRIHLDASKQLIFYSKKNHYGYGRFIHNEGLICRKEAPCLKAQKEQFITFKSTYNILIRNKWSSENKKTDNDRRHRLELVQLTHQPCSGTCASSVSSESG